MFEYENQLNMRHEYKYPLRPGEFGAIRQRCKILMQRDPHVGADGTYTIVSLYFDDAADSALLANKSGLSHREKFRIRCYNYNKQTLHLEKKFKSGGLGTKFACPITEEELDRIVRGDIAWTLRDERQLLAELGLHMKNERLAPKTIVSYRREPFIYRAGNVRVTFDYDIRSGVFSTDLLNESVPLVPAAPGLVLMEVKYDRFLPGVIQDILQENTLRVSAFSKYAACRQFDA